MSRTALADLARNVVAGARLASFLPVAQLDFRIRTGSLVALMLLSALLDIGVDFARHGEDAVFSWLGVSGETYAAAALLFVSALLSLALRQRALLLALPTLIFAAYPAVQFVRLALLAAEHWAEVAGVLAGWQDDVLLAWTAAIFVRAAAIALVPARPLRWARAALVALALLLPLWFGSTFAPDTPWFTANRDTDPSYPNPAAEPVMEAQRMLLEEALSGFADARPGVTDLYLIGFAAGESDALRSDVLSAIEVMDERWATDGRSVAFINHRASVLEQPMATVSNLRDALAELQQVIDLDEDVVMLYVAGMGAPGGGIKVALPPFDLLPITPVGVRRLLDDVGIRWRIVVVTSCYSGAWLEALAGDTTLVITATDATGAGAGCALAEDGSAFGSALFGHGMTEADTVEGAFALARSRIAERAQGAASGLPQIVVGPAMAGKLRELERGRAARRASRSV